MTKWDIIFWFLDWGWLVVAFFFALVINFVVIEGILLYKEYKQTKRRKRNEKQ